MRNGGVGIHGLRELQGAVTWGPPFLPSPITLPLLSLSLSLPPWNWKHSALTHSGVSGCHLNGRTNEQAQPLVCYGHRTRRARSVASFKRRSCAGKLEPRGKEKPEARTSLVVGFCKVGSESSISSFFREKSPCSGLSRIEPEEDTAPVDSF